jgi:hypothetical protein
MHAETFGADRLKLKKTFTQPKKWSHQRELERLKGKKIWFMKQGDKTKRVADLLEADQFTLRLAVELDNGTFSHMTVFKSALVAYGAV